MLRIYCKNTDTFQEFQEGTTLLDMLPAFDFERPYDILSAKVNNVSEGLKFRVFNNRDVEFLDYRSYNGRSIYCRSLSFLLCKAMRDLHPGYRVILRRPISKGYFCTVDKPDGTPITPEEVEAVRVHMRELVTQDIPFRRHEVQTAEAIRIFMKLGMADKVKLLRTCDDVYITYYTLQDTADYFYDALVPGTGLLKVWELSPYQGGMLLRVPDRHAPTELAPFYEQPKTFEIFRETLRWNRIMGLANVGDVNDACQQGQAPDLIEVAEALQEKKIVEIAEEINRRHALADPVRIVLITGPTSSGKSTFCRRLSVQLKACGLHPVSFSTDDYFVNRLDTPKLPDGTYDFDNFDTVDHDYLQEDVTDMVPESAKFRIFINTVTSISLDDHNCIPTSDNRLLRRIVRDYNKGAFSARETIANWPNVRRAEVKWIYPYQETADVLFNSAYLLEFAVLRTHAERILATVPKNCPEYSEAHRLLHFLHYFVPVSDKDLPATSFIRSFIDK